eukprot:8074578-Alexandrium_andersonii.AAC.1
MGAATAPPDPPRKAPPASTPGCFAVTIGISAQIDAEPSDEALQAGNLRPFLSPRGSSSERLKQ